MAVNTLSSNFAADVSTYIAAKLLMLAKKSLALYQLCDLAQLPKNEGRTVQYTRYERVNLPQTPLTEGVTPTDTQMTISTVQAVMDQWGAVIPISDVAIDSVKHPVLQQAIMLASLQAQETLDREVAETLLSGTNVFFPDAVASRSALAAANTLDSDVLGQVTANLRTDGAHPKMGSHYVGAVHPFGEEDIIKDSTFIEVHRYGHAIKLLNQEIGTWKGVRWVRSNTLPNFAELTGGSGAGAVDGSGLLAAATNYDFGITVVDAATGFETYIHANIDVLTGGGDDSVDVTLPALPAGATAGSTMNVYAGNNGATKFLSSTGNAAAAVVRVLSIPTSGDVYPAEAPVGGLRVYTAWVFGMQGVICTELNRVRAFLTPATPTDSDPLVQRRKVGWKTDFKSVISNNDFLARLEYATTSG